MRLPDYVRIGEVQKNLTAALQQGWSGVFVLTDENTNRHCYPLIASVLPSDHRVITIPSGEEHKNLHTCQKIWQALTEAQADRNALLINLGGGVIGDMGGFCAATYKRGIAFIQIPTTLLAQTDASVGGKLGIDFHGFKNHIGVFCPPAYVLIDTCFLATLPLRELRSGFAELLKHALIADAEAWQELTRSDNWLDTNWEKVVPHSVALKQQVVEQDPNEKGLRKILNFGHTVGHAVEGYFLESQPDENRLLHGEAVAAGMIAESWLAVQKRLLPQESYEEIKKYLLRLYGKINIPSHAISEIARMTLQDKKNQNGTIALSLIERIGSCRFNVPASLSEIEQALREYGELSLA